MQVVVVEHRRSDITGSTQVLLPNGTISGRDDVTKVDLAGAGELLG